MQTGPGANDDGLTLPQWFRAGDNPYFCGLIAHQLRRRAHALRAEHCFAAALEADRIAVVIEAGAFEWLT
jgi:hypothetical protein